MRFLSGADRAEPTQCVLMVEDEMNLALMLEDILVDAGYRVLKAARLPQALALAESEAIDAAILDVNLAGVPVFPVATVLDRRGIPFMFASGYGRQGVAAEFKVIPVLQKPYSVAQLIGTLKAILAPPVGA